MFKSKPFLQSMQLSILMIVFALNANADLTDPTRPDNFAMSHMSDGFAGDSGMQSPDTMTIQAIFYRPSGSSVMINGRRYRVNDQLSEYTIKTIMPDQVILVGTEGEKIIRFIRTPVKFKDEATASQVKD